MTETNTNIQQLNPEFRAKAIAACVVGLECEWGDVLPNFPVDTLASGRKVKFVAAMHEFFSLVPELEKMQPSVFMRIYGMDGKALLKHGLACDAVGDNVSDTVARMIDSQWDWYASDWADVSDEEIREMQEKAGA